MSYVDDLLGLARKMANYRRADFRAARHRRAISTAYYALFHLLLESGSAKIVAHAGTRQLVSRAYNHTDMAKAARWFFGGLPPQLAQPLASTVPSVPPEIVRVAETFITLQEARHTADYDLSRHYSYSDAQQFVKQVTEAFADWRAVSSVPAHQDMCELFLAALLLGDRLRR